MLRIIKLEAKDVHGYIPLDIKFDNQLTFLTGANGSGKTTALKLISAILQPNFDLIETINFATASLCFTIENTLFEISFVKTKNKLHNEIIQWTFASRDLKNKNVFGLPNIAKGEFKLFPKTQRILFGEERTSIKENLYNEFINSDYYRILQNISTPVFLGIDRKILGSLSQIERKSIHSFSSRSSINERSFYEAQRVIVDYVSSMADKKKALSENFKTNIFKSLFEYVTVKKAGRLFSTVPNAKLESQKAKVLASIDKLELGSEISEAIEKYYDSIIKIQPKVFAQEKGEQDFSVMNEWFINRTHLQRIEAISTYADKFQKEVDKLDKPLNEIVRLANIFFIESNKLLKINPSGFINVLWRDKDITTRNLSSGEMQIIVLLTHLVFCEHRKDSPVFVIDEPELSLHLSWQEKFVDAVLEASPSTQFIMATHSPAIISNLEYEQKAIYIKNI